MFTLASITTNVSALPAGIILDRYGPKVTSIAGCIFMILGCIFTGVANYVPFDAWLLGYLFLALGGTFSKQLSIARDQEVKLAEC